MAYVQTALLIFTAGINTNKDEATELLADAEQLLNASRALKNGPIRDSISNLDDLGSALEQSVNELRPVYDQLFSDLDRVKPLVNQVLYLLFSSRLTTFSRIIV